MKIFLAQIYCLFFLFIIKYKYHRNENISGANLLLVPLRFWLEYRYQSNENISSANLLLVPFSF